MHLRLGSISLHVLWVAPDPLTRLRVQRRLGARGLTLRGTADGLEALREFRADPFAFDAALVDLELPDMRGVEVARHLRRVRPGLPVCLVAPEAGEARLFDGDAGITVVSHPLDPDALIGDLRELVGRRRLTA